VKAILNSAATGHIVLDLFAGSGSTIISSEKAGRVCYAMELEPKYVDVSVTRLLRYLNDFSKDITVKRNGTQLKPAEVRKMIKE